MKDRPFATLIRAIVTVALALPLGAATFVTDEPAARAAETHSSRGVIKSFGPGRKYVNIAHEKIPGYMEAMTMSFEPRSADQLAKLAEGDHVVFSFTADDNGRRLLDAIRRE
jgi:Cu(I)/Ag(I) efflux system protein CusF